MTMNENRNKENGNMKEREYSFPDDFKATFFFISNISVNTSRTLGKS